MPFQTSVYEFWMFRRRSSANGYEINVSCSNLGAQRSVPAKNESVRVCLRRNFSVKENKCFGIKVVVLANARRDFTEM